MFTVAPFLKKSVVTGPFKSQKIESMNFLTDHTELFLYQEVSVSPLYGLSVAYLKYEYVKYSDAEKSQNTDDSPLFRYETFIPFLTFSFSTRGERDSIFTMLTVPTSSFSQPPAGLPGPESNLN